MILLRRRSTGFLLLALLTACTQSPKSKTKEGEISSTPYMNPFYGSSELDTQKAAGIFGFDTNATPNTFANANCIGCHSSFAGVDGIQTLGEETYRVLGCFDSDPQINARGTLACLAKLAIPSNGQMADGQPIPARTFTDEELKTSLLALTPKDLGIFAAAAGLSTVEKIFNTANMSSLFTEWKAKVGMPYGRNLLPDQDALLLVQWYVSGLTDLEKYVLHNGPDVCRSEANTFIGSKIKEHVTRMSLEGEGWEFVNLARGLTMFGCSDMDKSNCFQQKQDASDIFPTQNDWLQTGVKGQIRKLHTFQNSTNYWIRSSADGRFVAAGGSPSIVVDLLPKMQGKEARINTVKAEFDPSFAPDNQSFMFQGQSGSRVCVQTLLEGADPVTIDFLNEGCSKSNLDVGLYQGLGNNLANGDIVTIAGGFQSDSGDSVFQEIAPLFSKSSDLTVSTIRQSSASAFEKVSQYTIPTPFHASWMASPSQILAAGIVSASTDSKARHGGYRLIMLDESLSKKGELPSWDDPSTASICTGSGEKPNFSFDERFLAYYSYDKNSKKLSPSESSANLFVVDLLGDGKPVQITQMPKGLYAQFPHFRSDGWLYFSVYDSKNNTRFVMTTDAVFKMAL